MPIRACIDGALYEQFPDLQAGSEFEFSDPLGRLVVIRCLKYDFGGIVQFFGDELADLPARKRFLLPGEGIKRTHYRPDLKFTVCVMHFLKSDSNVRSNHFQRAASKKADNEFAVTPIDVFSQ